MEKNAGNQQRIINHHLVESLSNLQILVEVVPYNRLATAV